MATRLEGIAFDLAGQPLVGVTVQAYDRRGMRSSTATTDGAGFFRITGLEDRDWLPRISSGEQGYALPFVQGDFGILQLTKLHHNLLEQVLADQHHPQDHLSDHHTGGSQALSLGLIAGTVIGPGHGDQTGEGSAIHDGGDLTYTPAVLTDWDGDVDPGAIDDALDQLAERVDDNEALAHAQSHGVADHSSIIGERQVEIIIPLSKALPGATNNATLDDDYLYKKPYNVARRINKWYIRFESNLAAQATFELRKNGTAITGASITVSAAARDATVDAFTETTLAADDSLEVWQTAGNAEDIGGRAYVYGDEDVVAAVT